MTKIKIQNLLVMKNREKKVQSCKEVMPAK